MDEAKFSFAEGKWMVKYIVQPGDTLGNIAVKYRTTVRAIVKANGIRDPNMLHVGQIIRIPTDSYHTSPSSQSHQSHHHEATVNPWHHDEHYHKSGH
jgi:LysM repeat protein